MAGKKYSQKIYSTGKNPSSALRLCLPSGRQKAVLAGQKLPPVLGHFTPLAVFAGHAANDASTYTHQLTLVAHQLMPFVDQSILVGRQPMPLADRLMPLGQAPVLVG